MLSDEAVQKAGRVLANRIRDAREAAGLSKNMLAQTAGVSVQTVSFIEEAVNSPSVSTLLRLSDALDVKPEVLLKGLV